MTVYFSICKDDLTKSSQKPRYPLGFIYEELDSNSNIINKYIYIKSNGLIKYQPTQIFNSAIKEGEYTNSSPKAITQGAIIGICNLDIPKDQHCFVQIQGKTTCKVSDSATDGEYLRITQDGISAIPTLRTLTSDGFAIVTKAIPQAGEAKVFLLGRLVEIKDA